MREENLTKEATLKVEDLDIEEDDLAIHNTEEMQCGNVSTPMLSFVQ